MFVVLATLCAVLCSWVILRVKETMQENHRRYQIYLQQCEAAEAIRKVGGEIRSGGHSNGELSHCVYFRNTSTTDSELKPLKELGWVVAVDLKNTKITDPGLEILESLDRLHYVNLKGTKVTDKGVEKLQQALPNCRIER
jgi:hypothetical protein